MQVVECALAGNGVDLAQSSLTPDELLARFASAEAEPRVFLLCGTTAPDKSPAGTFHLLEWVREHFQLRAAQNASKSLSASLHGGDMRPAIQAKYQRVRTCLNAVERLLQDARYSRTAPRTFLLLLKEDAFSKIWSAAAAPIQHTPRASAFAEVDFLDDQRCEQILLDRASHPPVPESLCQWYLGRSDKIELVRRLILRAGQVNTPVLIIGESGTGKERVARAIHDYGCYRGRNFIAANCAAIPEGMFESELFGHIRGAFTGAIRARIGLWRQTGDGTLFLDEIGDMSLNHQAKLLRALQENKVRPMGGEDSFKVNARIIAATNRDLQAMIRAGSFREDLYFRLSGFPLVVPALRQHPEDIPMLARHFWAEITGANRPTLPPSILAEMQRVDWPGNVRELRAFLHHLHGIAAGAVPDLSLARTVLYQRRAPLRLRTPGSATA